MERSTPIFIHYLSLLACALTLALPLYVYATDYPVTLATDTPDPGAGVYTGSVVGELRWAITQANQSVGNSITITVAAASVIQIGGGQNKPLPALTQGMVISTINDLTIQGALGPPAIPIFFVFGTPNPVSPYTPTPIVVDITGPSLGGLTLLNGKSQGGDGGGGALGAGGALFINQGMFVNLTNITFTNNVAQGGNGTANAGTGGGGLVGGTGGLGAGFPANAGGGGGGVAGLGGAGNNAGGNPGIAGLVIGATSGGDTEFGGTGGANGGGGGGGNIRSGGGGGVGGGDVTSLSPFPGTGGFGGGSGGSFGFTGSLAGYGGGGGSTLQTGGNGGFGGGGGAGTTAGGTGGFGGGNGDTVTGGGGAGFGGSIFAGGNEGGGTPANLIIISTRNTNFSGGSVLGGTGANPGSAEGTDIYASGGVLVRFQPGLSFTQTQNGSIGGPGAIRQEGAGTLVLNAASTYSGGTTLGTGTPATSGFLTVGNDDALGTGDLTLAGGTLQSNAAITISNAFSLTADSFIGGSNNLTINAPTSTLNGNLLTVNNTAGTITLGGAGTLSGTGGVTKTGAGTLVYSTPKTYTGLTTINDGTLRTGISNVLPNNTNDITLGGINAIFDLNGTTQTIGNLSGTAGRVTLGVNGSLTLGTATNTSYAGIFTGTVGSSIIKQGSGTLTLTGNSLGYAGTTTLSGGTIAANNNRALGTGTIVFDGGTLLTDIANTTLANAFRVPTTGTIGGVNNLILNGPGAPITGTLSVTNTAMTTLGGVLGGTGAINANMSGGTLLLLGNNGAFTGSTTLANGTIIIGNTNALGTNASTNALVLNGNSFLQSNGAFSISNGFTVNGASTINGSNDLTLTGTGVLNAALSITNTATTTLSGNLSGGGSIIADMGTGVGTRKLILSGNNSYGGGTTLTSGTTAANSNSALGGGLLTFNGGTLITDTLGGTTLGNAFTVTAQGGTIGGTENLTLNGAGNLAGTLVNTNTATTTLANNLTGNGGLTQQAGLLILNGTNDYTGGTLVSGGILQGDTNSLQGTITNNATVIFDQGFVGTYTGAMIGTGQLIKTNIGTLILTGPNTYSGGTTVSAGVLQGNTNSVQGNIINNATVVFDQNINSGDYTSVMSGIGTLIKQGPGTVILTNANTYTGLTTVNAGELRVNGSLVDSVVVNSGGTLSGIGVMGGTVTNNSGGIVAPGNGSGSMGTLKVGAYTQFPGSTLSIEFNAGGQTDLLQVMPGPAIINGGTVQFTPDAGFYFPGTTYTFLTASGGVSGQFTNITFTNNNLGPLKTQVIYNPTSIQLVILGVIDTTLKCLTPNEILIGKFINTFPVQGGSDLGEVLTILGGLDPCGMNGPLEQIGSTESAATNWVMADNISQAHLVNTRRLDILRHFRRCEEETEENYPCSGYAAGDLTRKERMGQRISAKKRVAEKEKLRTERHRSPSKKIRSPREGFSLMETCQMPDGGVWIRGYGNKVEQGTLRNSRGFGSRNNGFMLGIDFELSDEWLLGVSGGKVYSHVEWNKDHSKAHINSVLGSLYATWYSLSGFYLEGSFIMGDSRYSMDRHLNFGTLNRYAHSSYRSFEVSPHAGIGYVVPCNESIDTEMFGSIEYLNLQRDRYTEKGAGILNLAVHRKEVGFVRTEAGAGISQLMDCDWALILLKARLSYVNKNPIEKSRITAGFVGLPGNFSVESYTQMKHQAALGLGIHLQFCTSGFFSIFYDGEYGGKTVMNAASARIGMQF